MRAPRIGDGREGRAGGGQAGHRGGGCHVTHQAPRGCEHSTGSPRFPPPNMGTRAPASSLPPRLGRSAGRAPRRAPRAGSRRGRGRTPRTLRAGGARSAAEPRGRPPSPRRPPSAPPAASPSPAPRPPPRPPPPWRSHRPGLRRAASARGGRSCQPLVSAARRGPAWGRGGAGRGCRQKDPSRPRPRPS